MTGSNGGLITLSSALLQQLPTTKHGPSLTQIYTLTGWAKLVTTCSTCDSTQHMQSNWVANGSWENSPPAQQDSKIRNRGSGTRTYVPSLMHWVAVASGSDASISMRVENAEAATQLKPAPSGQKPLQVLTASVTAWGMQLLMVNS